MIHANAEEMVENDSFNVSFILSSKREKLCNIYKEKDQTLTTTKRTRALFTRKQNHKA